MSAIVTMMTISVSSQVVVQVLLVCGGAGQAPSWLASARWPESMPR
jgi:hypothetical protein